MRAAVPVVEPEGTVKVLHHGDKATARARAHVPTSNGTDAGRVSTARSKSLAIPEPYCNIMYAVVAHATPSNLQTCARRRRPRMVSAAAA